VLDILLYGLYSSLTRCTLMKIPHKGSEEARNELPALLEDAEDGRATIITRRGRPVAALVPLAQYRVSHRQRSLLTLEGSGRGMWGKNSAGTLKKLRGEWSR
jgi:prevent-host-death family protein